VLASMHTVDSLLMVSYVLLTSWMCLHTLYGGSDYIVPDKIMQVRRYNLCTLSRV